MKKIDLKKIIFYSLPILMIVFVIIVFKDGKQDISFEKNEASTLLVPDARGDQGAEDKVLAYKQDKLNRLSREREKEESRVRGKDFFFDLADDERWETPEEKKMKTGKDTLNPVDLYEEVVMKKGGGRRNYEKIMADKTLQNSPMAQEVNKLQKGMDSVNSATTKQQEGITFTPDGRRLRARQARTQEGGGKLISACIHGDQEVTSGGVIRMRLLEPLVIDQVKFPENTLFYGKATISEDRMQVRVENLKIGEKMVSVLCSIYDNDAIVGLNLPDNVKNELVRRTKQEAIDGVYLPRGGDVISGAITSVISGAKSVLRKEETRIKVTLKANYKIFIKEI